MDVSYSLESAGNEQQVRLLGGKGIARLTYRESYFLHTLDWTFR